MTTQQKNGGPCGPPLASCLDLVALAALSVRAPSAWREKSCGTRSRAKFVWQLQHLERGFNLLKLGILVHQRGIPFLRERRNPGVGY